jgi:hypothetical protein
MENQKADVTPFPEGLEQKQYAPLAEKADVVLPPETKALEPAAGEASKKAVILKDLSRKSLVFLELLVAGYDTLKAYEMAGFKGKDHAAYQLKSDLRHHLTQLLEAHGVSRNDIKMEVLKLLKLPLSSSAAVVTFDEKLKLLKFMDKLTESEPQTKTFTPFDINVSGNVTINEKK